MTKLYYTNPLKAAWMAREFGVRLLMYGLEMGASGVWDKEVWNEASEQDLRDFLESSLDEMHKPLKVHPDSYDIFEPQEGDLVSEDNWPCLVVSEEVYQENRGTPMASQLVSIEAASPGNSEEEFNWWIAEQGFGVILRNNKQFFMPEVG